MRLLTTIFLSLIVSLFFSVGVVKSATFNKSLSSTNLKTGLVGWWTFDGQDSKSGSGGYALDKSGNGSIASVTAGTFVAKSGKIGQALENKNTDSLLVGDKANLSFTDNRFAFSFWYYPNEITSQKNILEKYVGGSYEYSIFNSAAGGLNKLNLGTWTSGGTDVYNVETSYATTVAKKWQYITYSSDGSQVKIYVNGVLERTINKSANSMSDTVGTFKIGDGAYNAYPPNHSIDDLRVYNRALSLAEIQQLYKMGGGKFQQSLAPTDLKTGLVGWWTFDGKDSKGGTGGYALDKSGNGRTLTNVDNAAYNPTMSMGKIGQASKFDGANDYWNAPNFLLPYPFTTSIWFNLSDNSTTRTLFRIGSQGATSPHFWTYITGGGFRTSYSNGTSVVNYDQAGSNPTLNKWHLFNLVIDSSGVANYYLDGVLNRSLALTTPANFVSADLFRIGAYQFNDARFVGSLDDARIYNRALSATEIQQLYKMGGGKFQQSLAPTGLKSGLVGWWTFDGADVNATKVLDKAGTNHGTRTGGVVMSPGKIGQAGKFDGVDDTVAFSQPSITNVYTFSAWAKRDSTAGVDAILFGYNGSYYGLDIGATTLITASGSGGITLATGLVNNNKWRHYVVTRNGDTVTGYIDGVSYGAKTGMGTTALILTKLTDASSYWWKGLVDDQRVYNRALSATEIQQLYKMGK